MSKHDLSDDVLSGQRPDTETATEPFLQARNRERLEADIDRLLRRQRVPLVGVSWEQIEGVLDRQLTPLERTRLTQARDHFVTDRTLNLLAVRLGQLSVRDCLHCIFQSWHELRGEIRVSLRANGAQVDRILDLKPRPHSDPRGR